MYKKYIPIGILLIAAAILRFWHLGAQSLWIDEGFTINAAQGILKYGYPLLDSMQLYTGHIFHNYLTAGSMGLLGFDAFSPVSARIPAAIFGVLAVAAMYFVTFRLYKNRWLAFLAAFITVFLYWEIAWSRQVRGYIDVQFFILLSIYFYWTWLKTKRLSSLCLAGLTFVAAYLSHNIAAIFLPGYLLSFMCYWFLYREKKFPRYQLIALVVIGIAVLIITKLPTKLPSMTFYKYFSSYSDFLFTTIGFFSIGSLVGFALGVSSKKTFWRTIFLGNFLFFPFIIVAFYSTLGHHRYIFPLYVLMILMTIGILDFVWQKNFGIKKLIFRKAKNIIFVAIFIALAFSTLTFIPRDLYELEPGSPQPDFKTVYQMIKNDPNPDKVILSSHAHMTKIYLDETGYWLPASLTGKKLKPMVVDRYVGAPIMDDPEKFAELIGGQSGYIVLDVIGRYRLDEKLYSVISSHPKVELIYSSGGNKTNEIWLYKF